MAEKDKRLIALGRGGGNSGDPVWGTITGTLSDQTDLQDALNSKASASDIPTATSDLENDSGYITLNDVPAQVRSNWNESDTASPAYIQNKPSIPAAQVQSDWNQSDNTSVDYIKNKPTIPAAQVNSDWNASSGVAEILNKPTIPTVNDSTITIQQDGTTVGTFTTNDTNDTTINLTGGGGGSDWYGTQMQFDNLGTYDPDTNYYITDKLDYNTDLKNTPNLSFYATKTEVNTKNAQQDGEIAGKLGGHFMTQQEFDALGNNVPEGENYFIQGDTIQMVVTFTDQSTATYNVVVD